MEWRAVDCDICRDGGSYALTLERSEEQLSLMLAVDHWDRPEDRAYCALYQSRGPRADARQRYLEPAECRAWLEVLTTDVSLAGLSDYASGRLREFVAELRTFCDRGAGHSTWGTGLVRAWEEMVRRGPSASLPTRAERTPSVAGDNMVNLYALVYSASDFDSLSAFVMFAHYTSSVQQSLTTTGEIDLRDFYPVATHVGVRGVESERASSRQSESPDAIARELKQAGLPAGLTWVVGLAYEQARWSLDGLTYGFYGKSEEGYVLLFRADDHVDDHEARRPMRVGTLPAKCIWAGCDEPAQPGKVFCTRHLSF